MDYKHHVGIAIFVLPLISLSSFAKSCYPDHRVLPKYSNTKNYLSFENFGYRGIGRCRGHAIVTQRMELLAKFNPKAPHPCKNIEAEACYTTIYQKVKQVMSGQIVQIGGFDSLYEFSKDPTARQVLRNRIINIPHRYQAEDSPIEDVNVFNEIVRRISLKVRPYIAIKGASRISSHGLLGYKVIKDARGKKICVRDPNVVIHEAPFENCQNYIYSTEEQIYYRQFGFAKDERLSHINLKTDDDERTDQYIDAHYEACIKRSTTQK